MNKLDMALGDITSKSGGRGGRGGRRGGGRGGRRGGGSNGEGFINPLDRDNDMEVPSASDETRGAGPIRRGRERPSTTPYSRPSPTTRRPARAASPVQSAGPVKSITIGSNKVLVTNLDSSINEEDIEEIFESAGGIKSVNLKTDAQGRSLGTAEVVFSKRAVAVKTVEDYDGAAVDGRPMYLRLLDAAGSTIVRKRPEQERFRPAVTQERPATASRASFGGGAKESLFGSKIEELEYAAENFSSFGRRGGGFGRRGGAGGSSQTQGGRGRGGRSRGRGGGGGGFRDRTPPSAEQLDKEMDSYFGSSKVGGAAMDEA